MFTGALLVVLTALFALPNLASGIAEAKPAFTIAVEPHAHIVAFRGHYSHAHRSAVFAALNTNVLTVQPHAPSPIDLSDFDLIHFDNTSSILNQRQVLRVLAEHPDVAHITPQRRMTRTLKAPMQLPFGEACQDSSQIGQRKLLRSTPAPDVTLAMGAPSIWQQGFTGKGIAVGIFDTGLRKDHPHFRNIIERTDWTDEMILDDVLGHGTFVAGIIASQSECLGFAPDVDLHIYRVFTSKQESFTSWFLDAFNFAIHRKINIINLSIGGPDFFDRPFVEKVWELSANNIIMVSAIGNDGPLYGTLNNPADQLDVIGVGGVDADGNLSPFSSRGMTTWELPSGYGRMKPDIVAMSQSVSGSSKRSGCRTLSGTSVASPVVAGCIALIASAVSKEFVNIAFVKQALVESAMPVAGANMFEQGSGAIQLLEAFTMMMNKAPRVSLLPPNLDATDCPYSWPYCSQPLYAHAMPVIVNVTILNSISPSSVVEGPPTITALDSGGELLDILVTHSQFIWPWSGYFAVSIRVKPAGEQFEGIASVEIKLRIRSRPHQHQTSSSVVDVAFQMKWNIVATPVRQQRILWDQFHSLRYPSGYFPRDNLRVKTDALDWNGDHIHTNFRDLYLHLRQRGYYVEVLGEPITCFDALQYGTLIIMDPEEEYFPDEVQKLYSDVQDHHLSVLVVGDWYNGRIMNEKIRFFDENTRQWWNPETGGANIPALNELLHPFGMAFGSVVYTGEFKLGGQKSSYLSGTSIVRFPEGGMLAASSLLDMENEGSSTLRVFDLAPVLGMYQTRFNGGRVIVFGDSNCFDSAHMEMNCYWLLDKLLDFAVLGGIDRHFFEHLETLKQPFVLGVDLPSRISTNRLHLYSNVISHPNQYRSLPMCSSGFVPNFPINRTFFEAVNLDYYIFANPASLNNVLPKKGNQFLSLRSFPVYIAPFSVIVLILLFLGVKRRLFRRQAQRAFSKMPQLFRVV